MKFWWLVDMYRVATEREAVEALSADGWWSVGMWRVCDHRLCVEGTVTAGGKAFAVRLVYPDQYPLVPCWVEPRDGGRWSAHQYGDDGPLCLELRPDNWTPDATGADMLRSAWHLLEAEVAGEGTRVPSAHHVGALQAFNAWEMAVLTGAGCIGRIEDGVATGLIAHRWPARDGFIPVYLSDDIDRAAGRAPPDTVATPIYVVEIDADPATIDTVVTAEDLSRLAGNDARIDAAVAFLVIVRSPGGVDAFHGYGDGDERVYRRVIHALADDAGRRSNRAGGAAGKQVAIVGAGSVGSKVAVSLVRSGVRDIVLLDGDLMLPANLERHALDWRDVGYRKVEGVKAMVLDIAPDTQVVTEATNLSWQKSASSQAGLVDLLAGADVILDATGDVPTSLFLGALAASSGRAFVSAQVFEGGLGSLVARAIPGRDPAFVTALGQYRRWCEEQGKAPPVSGHRAYEALDGEGAPVVADDAAVTMAAGVAARVVLDILDGQVEDDQPAWLLSGYRKGWVFDGLGAVVRLDMGRSAPEPDHRLLDDVERETAGFVLRLSREAQNAAGTR